MEFKINRDKKTLLNVMKSKGEKKNIKVVSFGDKIEISLESGKYTNGEDNIPVTFKGKISEEKDTGIVMGHFSYGFYLYTLVIFAAVLIAARFVWSVIQKQVDNMILCGIVTVLLIIVMTVVHLKASKGKKVIEDFLRDVCQTKK